MRVVYLDEDSRDIFSREEIREHQHILLIYKTIEIDDDEELLVLLLCEYFQDIIGDNVWYIIRFDRRRCSDGEQLVS